MNGDGFSDVVIGATRHNTGHSAEGSAFVWHGSPTGVNENVDGVPSNADFSAEANRADADLGFSVASAGGLNGDGFDDIIVGAPSYGFVTSDGRAFVWLGSSSGATTTDGMATGTPSNAFWSAESIGQTVGTSVASARDVNGDGYSDLIVGAAFYSNGEAIEGAVFVWLGNPAGIPTGAGMNATGTPSNAIWSAESNQWGAKLGTSVAGAGDVNDDGFGDIIVGSPAYENGEPSEGSVFVWHGTSTGITTTVGTTTGIPTNAFWTAESDQTNGFMGQSVGSIGDVNGDGISDVVVGAPGYQDGQIEEGAVFIWHGGSGGVNAGTPGLPTNSNWSTESDSVGALFG